jgi:hypothetical protein
MAGQRPRLAFILAVIFALAGIPHRPGRSCRVVTNSRSAGHKCNLHLNQYRW